jgi:hypothetical protein
MPGKASLVLTNNDRGTVSQHGGGILSTWGSSAPTAYVIFWGTTWNAGVGDIIPSVNSFVQGIGNSGYAQIWTEYGANPLLSYGTTYIDNTSTPSSAPPPPPDSYDVQNYLCDVIQRKGIPQSSNALYLIIGDSVAHVPPLGGAGYHAHVKCGVSSNPDLKYAVVWQGPSHIGGDPNHSLYAAGIAQVLGHEIAELFTDADNVPDPGHGWYTTNNPHQEIADKCEGVFKGFQTLANGAQFQLTGVWSNQAFLGVYGDTNELGEHGCMFERPLTAPVYGEASVNSNVNCYYTVSAYGGYPPYGYQWSIDGTIESGQGDLGVWVQFAGDGSRLVSVLVTDSRGNHTYGNLYVTTNAFDPPGFACRAG